MDKKKENSSAEARDIPASWPAAIVDIEREVPGDQQMTDFLYAGELLRGLKGKVGVE